MPARPEPVWKKFIGCLLLPLTPILILLIPILRAFGWDRTKEGPERIIEYLDRFIEGTEYEWDWDDFCSIPFADPELDDLRDRACRFEPPTEMTDEDREELQSLLREAHSIQNRRETGCNST